MERKLVQTADGSHTLFVPELNENYHSVHGAIQESQHVFIKSGLHACKVASPAILEIGLGTGLNAFLTLCEAERIGKPVFYESIEAYPISMEELGSLNYLELLNEEARQVDFMKLHEVSAEDTHELNKHFTFRKRIGKLQEMEFESRFDVIYFDAFAPEKQTVMWTDQVFAKMHAALKPGGFLVTYCAKGVVKRTMRAAGFDVEGIPGPPGKREMIRAVKK